MLKVQVPQLQKINPSLFEGLFYKFWPHYLRTELKNSLSWEALRSEFFYTGQTLATSIYTNYLRELFDAVNTNRELGLQYVDYDLTHHFDSYEADNVGNVFGFTDEEVESQIYHWISDYSYWLMRGEMVVDLTKIFSQIYNELLVVKQHHGLRGYWYEFFTTESKLWESNTFAIGIQDGDFESIYYGPWQCGAGTIFHQQMDVESWEFFLCGDKLYLEDGATQIPPGTMTTMCRLNDRVGNLINF